MDYTVLRMAHSLTVLLSLGLFLLRGFWMWQDSPRLQDKWVRVLPHINDSLLLIAAVALLVVASLNPLEQPWLLAKIVALLAYIAVGTMALKRGRTAAIRKRAFVGALALFAYMMAVAVTKQVIPGVA
jgi:uncharacterized membrane protein SirB2